MPDTATDAPGAPAGGTRPAMLCGGAAAALGVLVLVGWWLDMAELKSVLPGHVSMKPNTALAFVLAGAALALLSGGAMLRRAGRASPWLALLVALMGAVTLSEILFGWQLGIDEILFKDDPNALATSIPGRMAPSTAACFTLLGLALLAIKWQPRPGFRPAEALALVPATLSLLSLVEYALGEPILYGFGHYTRMALHTAAGLIVLSSGVLLARPAQGLVGEIRSGRISPMEQRVYAAIALALLAVLAAGAWLYRAEERHEWSEAAEYLDAVSQLKVNQIVQWRAERIDDAAVLIGNPFFVEGVARWLANPQAGSAEKILDQLRALRLGGRYGDALLTDASGRVRLAASGRAGALHAEELQALSAALRAQQPVLSDLHVDDGMMPHANLIAPLLRKTGATPLPLGVIVLTIDARQFLYPLIQSWPTPSRSAETLLIRRDGDDALYLNDLRHRPDTAFKLRIALNRREVPAVMAALGEEGMFVGTDYRGVAVLSVLRPIPDSPWFLITKIDEAEALADWRFRAGLIMAVIAALALALVAAGLTVWQQRSKYRALSRSEKALHKANRAYRVISECNEVLVRATEEAPLLHSLCRLLVEHGGYRLAWVGFAEQDEARSVRPVAHYGFDADYVGSLQVTWADTERGRGPTGTAIRTGQTCVARNILTEPAYEPWRDAAVRHGHASSIALPLKLNGVSGALSIYAVDPEAFDEQEIALLAELAGDLAYGIRTLRDHAERILAQTAVDNAKQRLEIALEGSQISVWESDLRSNEVWLDGRWAVLLGKPRLETRTTAAELLTSVHPDDRQRVASTAVQVMKREIAGYAVEHRVRAAGGDWKWILSRGRVIEYDAGGRPLRLSGTNTDITERKFAEQEIRTLNAELEQRVTERTAELQAANTALHTEIVERKQVQKELRAQTHLIAKKNVELEQASAMKSQFLANMSHELRTPLNAIIGFSEILKDGMVGGLTEQQKGFILDIHASGQHLLELINDILDLSKVEAGMMKLEPEFVDIGHLLPASLTIVKEKAMTHRLRLSLEVEPDIPPFSADPRRIKQIVYNLLANAVKFTPDGGAITLAARRVPRSGVGLPEGAAGVMLPLPPQQIDQYCEISVSDNGIGIEAVDMEKLFRPFVQIDSGLARLYQGTGLGLAMVKNLAELHGGTVALTSEPGRGSRFCVWLPLHAALPEQAAPQGAPMPPVQRGSGKPLALVIEDDDNAARIVELQLKAEGFECIRAATGEEGLARAAKQRPQLITLDIYLPNIDGWEVLERLKGSPQLAGIPVVIISITPDLVHGISLGATRVLQKPFTRDELVGVLHDAGVEAAAEQHATILVVDDNPAAVELLATHLAALGARVLRAYGGREAIDTAQRLRPDLILLDLMMPGVSGFEVMEALKSRPDTAAIPILVISANPLSAKDRAALDGDLTQVLQRTTFSTEAFTQEVRRALQRAGPARDAAENP